MNEDTRVVVHCYQGDQFQVVNALPQYQHHDCPVLVLSPADSPVTIGAATVRSAGLRGYTGQVTLDRQKAHLELLLEYPERWFLLHDSDSVCLEPQLPVYLYGSDTLFYNASPTHRFTESMGQPSWSKLVPQAFQPPLFFSREVLERMLEVSDKTMEMLPEWGKLIDWWFALMAQEAGIETKAFPDGISRPIWAPYEIARVYASVRTRGIIFLHSVKTKEALDVLVTGHAEYNLDPSGEQLCGSW